MVVLSRAIFSQRGGKNRFFDKLRVYVRGGSGGQGLPSYGGIGGKGGSVYVESSSKMTFKALQSRYPSKRFKAEEGTNSSVRRLQGAKGEDLIIPVPLGVCVIDDQKNTLADLDTLGERVLLADGGDGGSPDNDWTGARGERMPLTLELKLIADVGFVGFPNAGKSTLLKAMSRTQPKIAEYPFTTIRPQIGVSHYPDLRQISLADLPGLVEGAHYNSGMGHKFLRHIERTKLLLFVVDVHGFRLSPKKPFRTAYQTVMLLNRELELYKPEVAEKPALLAFNKLDVEGADTFLEEALESMDNTTAQTGDQESPEHPIKFRDTFAISAKEQTGIDRLKDRIREIIDEEAEKDREEEEDGRQKVER